MRALVAVLVVTVLLGVGFAVLVATRTLPLPGGASAPQRRPCPPRASAAVRCSRAHRAPR